MDLKLVSEEYREKFNSETREIVENVKLKKIFPKIEKNLRNLRVLDVFQEEDLGENSDYSPLLSHIRYRFLVELIKTRNSSLLLGSIKNGKKLFEHVQTLKLKKKPEIVIAGKTVRQNRDVRFFSDESIGYHYSGKLAKSKPLTSQLKKILEKINQDFSSDFNGILINKYSDGSNSIGKHSDDEKNLSNAGVVALSFGATRKFRIRDKKSGKIVLDVPSFHKSLIVMSGDFQKEFTHEIPPEKRIEETRYSLTFRKHKE